MRGTKNMSSNGNPPLRGMALKRAQREKRKTEALLRKKPKLAFGTSFKPSGGTFSAKGQTRTSTSRDSIAGAIERALPFTEGTQDPLDALLERVSKLKYKNNPYAGASATSESHARMGENSRPFVLRVDGGLATLPVDWTLKSSVVLRSNSPISLPPASAEAECDAVLSQSGRMSSKARKASAHAQNLSWERALMYYVYASSIASADIEYYAEAVQGTGAARAPPSGISSSTGTDLERNNNAYAEHAKTKARARARAKPAVPLRALQYTDGMDANAPFLRVPMSPCAAVTEQRQLWESAFRSAYLMLRFGHANCFYLVCPTASTVILFGRSDGMYSAAFQRFDSEGECPRGDNAGYNATAPAAAGAELFALLSPLGPALRSALRDADVGFELIEHEGRSASLGLSAGGKHGGELGGVAVFAGAGRCHALYEFLLNQPIGASSDAGEAVASTDPLIVAPCPFMLCTVRSLRIDRQCVQVVGGRHSCSTVDKTFDAGNDDAVEGGVSDKARYAITLRGFILPGAVRQLCATASQLLGPSAFDMHFHTDDRTQPFALPRVAAWYSKWVRSLLCRSGDNDKEDRLSGSAMSGENTDMLGAAKNTTSTTSVAPSCATTTTGMICRVVMGM